MDNPFSWLRHAYLASRKAMDDALSSYGVTFAQVEILMNLQEHDGLELRELQERVGTTAPTLTTVVDGLVVRQLVERRMNTDDARVKHVFLTDRGRNLNQELAQGFAAFQVRMMESFSSAERILLREWLLRIAENMDHTP